ncbi:tellurite resistance protein [Corynebacterium propinquum]|uniref:SLAC1 family transporter n=1 Tax=Corynebacterium propinquum TaxID=43769 RepID=UPI003D6D0D65
MLKIENKMELPPLGPGWAGAVMGLGISSSLIETHLSPVVGHLPAKIMIVAATLLALALSIGFIRHRNPGFRPNNMPAWGMVSRGILALGSAYSLIFNAWMIHILCWAAGTILGVITCLRYLQFLIFDRSVAPAFTLGLPLVAPMVSGTSSAQLVPHAGEWGSLVHGIGVMCFALATSVPTFAFVYLRTFPNLPTSFAATAWIPLGLVGQSTASAQLIAGEQWHFRAMIYGVVMLSLGIPLAGYAIVKHWGGQFLAAAQCRITPRGGPALFRSAPVVSVRIPCRRNPQHWSGVWDGLISSVSACLFFFCSTLCGHLMEPSGLLCLAEDDPERISVLQQCWSRRRLKFGHLSAPRATS